MKGRGGFWGDLWNGTKKSIATGVGGVLSAAGTTIGGMGQYTVPWKIKANSLTSNGSVPSVHSLGDAGMRLSHRELIGPVFSSTGFSSRTYQVNPGLDTTFPWLSGIAANFQQYELLGAVVTFKTSIPEGISTFGSLGSLMIAPVMSVSQPAATSQQMMEQTQFCAAGMPSETMVIPLECDRQSGGPGHLFVRTGTVPATGSLDSYDHAYIQVATINQPTAGVQIGQLYISYDIVLYNPTFLGQGATNNYARYVNTGTVTAACWIGTVHTKHVDTIGITFEKGATDNGYLVFPLGAVGNYIVQCQWYGDSSAITGFPTVGYTNSTGPLIFNGDGSNIAFSATGTSITTTSVSIAVNIPDSSKIAKIALSTGGTTYMPANATGVEVMVLQAPPTEF